MSFNLAESPNRRIAVGQHLLERFSFAHKTGAVRLFKRAHRRFSEAHRAVEQLTGAAGKVRSFRDAHDALVLQLLRHLQDVLVQAGQPNAFVAVRLYTVGDFATLSARRRSEAAVLLCQRLRVVRLNDDAVPHVLDALEVTAAQSLVQVISLEILSEWLARARASRDALVLEWEDARAFLLEEVPVSAE